MFHVKKPLICAEELKKQLPISKKYADFIKGATDSIKAILDGKDRRKLVIVGPCSIDDCKAAMEYAQKLKRVAEKVRNELYVVMRAYTAKPRSRGEGYLGLLHSQNGADNLESGLAAMRKLHITVASECELPTADEMVYPELAEYTDDVLAYITVGARSCENPTHRFVASGLDIPVGIKNPVNGNVDGLIGSVHAAKKSNEFIFCGNAVKTDGNAYAHAVLRGAVDKCGNYIKNCESVDIAQISKAFADAGETCCAIIDSGHGNSGKDISRVCDIVKNVFSCFGDCRYDAFVRGVMIESYLFDGCRLPNESGYGISVTDPCIGFEQTERLLNECAQTLSKRHIHV